jgi:hypothetical protein
VREKDDMDCGGRSDLPKMDMNPEGKNYYSGSRDKRHAPLRGIPLTTLLFLAHTTQLQHLRDNSDRQHALPS